MGTTSTSSVQTVARPPATVPPSPFESLRTLVQGMVQGSPLPVDAIAEEAWPEVLGLASYHGVLAALATDLAPSSDAVSSYAEFLSEYPRRVRAKNKFLAQELERIQQGLATQRVRSLGFKGPALTAFAYGSCGGEPVRTSICSSPPDALPVAREWLGAEGYRYTSQVKGRVGERARQFFDRQHTFTRGRSVFHIDLHTGIMPPLSRYAPDFDVLWERRQTIRMEGYEAEVLAPGDMLLSLCHQGLKDRWAWLKHVLDVAMLIPISTGSGRPCSTARPPAIAAGCCCWGSTWPMRCLRRRFPMPLPRRCRPTGGCSAWDAGRWTNSPAAGRSHRMRCCDRMQLHGLIQDSVRGSAQYAFYAALRKLWYYTEQVWPAPSA